MLLQQPRLVNKGAVVDNGQQKYSLWGGGGGANNVSIRGGNAIADERRAVIAVTADTHREQQE